MSRVARSKKLTSPSHFKFTADELRGLKGALVQFKQKTMDEPWWSTVPLDTGIVTDVEIAEMARGKVYKSTIHVCTGRGVVKINYKNRSIYVVCLEGGSEYSNPVPLWSQYIAEELQTKYLAEEDSAEESRSAQSISCPEASQITRKSSVDSNDLTG